jgi:hypothetical protein
MCFSYLKENLYTWAHWSDPPERVRSNQPGPIRLSPPSHSPNETLIPPRALATSRCRRHCRVIPMNSGGLRRRRVGQTNCRLACFLLTAGNCLPRLRLSPSSPFISAQSSSPPCRGDSMTMASCAGVSVVWLLVMSLGRRYRCGLVQIGIAVPLCCCATVPPAPSSPRVRYVFISSASFWPYDALWLRHGDDALVLV